MVRFTGGDAAQSAVAPPRYLPTPVRHQAEVKFVCTVGNAHPNAFSGTPASLPAQIFLSTA